MHKFNEKGILGKCATPNAIWDGKHTNHTTSENADGLGMVDYWV